MERFIDLAYKIVPSQILKPTISFVLVGVMLITQFIFNHAPTFSGELSKIDLFHIINIFIESIEIGLLVSILLFLPYLLTTILRNLNLDNFESSIKDIKKAIPFYYLMVVAVVLVNLLWEANYKLLLLTISLSVCAFIFAHFEKINKTIFLWATFFVLPTLLLSNAIQTV